MNQITQFLVSYGGLFLFVAGFIEQSSAAPHTPARPTIRQQLRGSCDEAVVERAVVSRGERRCLLGTDSSFFVWRDPAHSVVDESMPNRAVLSAA
jgi:hypothetical protein